ncbi:alpha/beta hydrolase family esterase [Maribacter sp. 2-571]|uniref:alpha/beta hydrolase family esterase n=1 Tax=Maribacter sp. 2-571 TaxID=3417569 RepID=UPI003D33326F
MKVAVVYVLLLLTLGCSSNETFDPGTDSASEQGLFENRAISISGETRTYHLYLPENPLNAPVVMLLHGNKSNNDEILGLTNVTAPYKIWLNIAEQENIILVVPNGSKGSTGDNGWNDCRSDSQGNPTSNDVLFASTLIDFVLTEYQANPDRVFVMGTSNGGQMAFRLAQELPEKLTAFAAIAAAKPLNTKCANGTTPISALIVNGTADPILPYEGGTMLGNRGEVHSAAETVQYWINRNSTETTPITSAIEDTDTTDNCTITKYLYHNGTNNTEVAFYEVLGGGHTEPSKAERYGSLFKLAVKEQNGDIEIAHEVWKFFDRK